MLTVLFYTQDKNSVDADRSTFAELRASGLITLYNCFTNDVFFYNIIIYYYRFTQAC